MVCEQPYNYMHLYQKSKSIFAIIVVYFDDLNLVGTFEELTKTIKYLKMEFEMKISEIFFFLSWPTN